MKQYTFFQNFRWYFAYVKKWCPRLLVTLPISVFFSALCSLLTIVLPAAIVTALTGRVPLFELFIRIIILGIGIGLCRYIASSLCNRNKTQEIALRTYFQEMLIKDSLFLPYEVIESPKSRTIRDQADRSALQNNASGGESFYFYTRELLQAVVTFMIFGTTLSFFSPWLFLFVIAVGALNYFSLRKVKHVIDTQRPQRAKLWSQERYINQTAYQVENGKDLRLYHMTDWFQQLLQQLQQKQQQLQETESRTYLKNGVIQSSALFIQNSLSYLYLIWAILQGIFTIGQFTLYLGIISQFSGIIQQINQKLFSLQQANRDLNDLRAWFDFAAQHKKTNPQPLPDFSNGLTIRFEDVFYRYPETEHDTLSHLSFELKAGEKLALVGHNGAGKTTLVKLLSGLISPTSGTIYLNDLDITTLDSEAYYQLIAPVFQDDLIFALDAGTNISLQNHYSEAAVWHALEKANLSEKIASFPKQLQTQFTRNLVDDGIDLSGGERQKLMLARALYKDAPILILDEPTAALDALAENQMYQGFQQLTKDKTALFVSHRLASTRFCDHILFLEGGCLIETGTHQDLLAQQGAYAKMYEVQSHYYQEVV